MDVVMHTQTHHAHSPHEEMGPCPRRIPCEVEAPDRGDSQHEAPETTLVRRAEAPDAGEGRAALIEHEFTHGRSQS
jgi:hypothetical protein